MKELITDCHGAGEAPGDHDHHEHQFAVAAKEQIRAICGLMNEYLPGFVGRIHGLDHRRRDAERTRQHGRRKNEHRYDQTNHAGAPPEFSEFAAPQHRSASDRDAD